MEQIRKLLKEIEDSVSIIKDNALIIKDNALIIEDNALIIEALIEDLISDARQEGYGVGYDHWI